VHDDVGLHRAHPLLNGGTELRRTRHPVPRRKHRCKFLRRITQTVNGGPCDDGRTRWPGRPGSASAAGSHAPVPGAGCWAGTSVCPWPRLSLLVAYGTHTGRTCLHMPDRDAVAVGKLVLLAC
jgi:hypothetical protein